MKSIRTLSHLAVLLASSAACQAVDRYVSLTSGHVPPFTSWADAATNIQDAIDAASPGDVVWVTNGVYATGGKSADGNLTNRITLDKALSVVSVNGPSATIIDGASMTNSSSATRCAWLTNGALLSGFTLRSGATRPYSTGDSPSQHGGGVFGTTALATIVSNCVIEANMAARNGGGAYGVILIRCQLIGNQSVLGVPSGTAGSGNVGGGGAAFCVLTNCALSGNSSGGSGGGAKNSTLQNSSITKNWAAYFGGGASSSDLVNCTVSGNTLRNPFLIGTTAGGGVYSCQLTNSIVYGNSCEFACGSNSDYDSLSKFAFSLANPLPAGVGNTNGDPKLHSDGIHLRAESPCLGAGSSNVVGGTDIDGQPWNTAPSMGCDEWRPDPVIAGQPSFSLSTPDWSWKLAVDVAGQSPFTCWWNKDGAIVENGPDYDAANSVNLVLKSFDPSDAGDYSVIVSNEFGMATSAVVRVTIHCVNASSTGAMPPFTNWLTAATTIQDAIEVASPGTFVIVTNGVYSSGGKSMDGDLTNRVALDKAITVAAINGPRFTTIKGEWDSVSTNGPGAVRCAWLAAGAKLVGFTLTGGATRTGTAESAQGGGVFSLPGAEVANCIIVSNCAWYRGGGAFGGRMRNCAVLENTVLSGSGLGGGGGVYGGLLANCTVTKNTTGLLGGGVSSSGLSNCIVYFNSTLAGSRSDVNGGTATYSCVSSQLGGVSNITSNPQLVDAFHLAETSPCRGRGLGSSLQTSDADIDGDAWLNPPSMGCDEFVAATRTGPLSVTLTAAWPEVVVNGALPLTANITGLASTIEWAFGDGSVGTNLSYITSRAWTNPGDYTVTFTAYNVDNPSGVSTNLSVHVVPLVSPTLTASGLTGKNFQLQFSSQAGATNRLLFATNLTPPVTWRTQQTLLSTGGLMQFIDTTATNEARYYRVLTQ